MEEWSRTLSRFEGYVRTTTTATTAAANTLKDWVEDNLIGREVDDDSLTKFLRKTMENFQSQMKDGIPDLHVPKMDPYHMDEYTMTEDKGNTKVKAKINSTTITGLSDFNIVKLEANPKTLDAEIELEFKSIRGEGSYLLDGVVFAIFPISGDGPFWIQADKIQAHGTAKLKTEDSHLFIESISLDLKTEEVKGHFDNILGGGELGELVNNLLNQFGKRLLDYYLPVLSKTVAESFQKKANNEMQTIPIGDLIPHETILAW